MKNTIKSNLKYTILSFFGQIYPKRVFSVQKRTNGLFYRIAHIGITPDPNFHSGERESVNIFEKITLRQCSQPKMGEKNITTEFSIIE